MARARVKKKAATGRVQADLEVLTRQGVTVGPVEVRPLPVALSRVWRLKLWGLVERVVELADVKIFVEGEGATGERAGDGGATGVFPKTENACRLARGVPREEGPARGRAGGDGDDRNASGATGWNGLNFDAIEKIARELVCELPEEVAGKVGLWLALQDIPLAELKAGGAPSETDLQALCGAKREEVELVLTDAEMYAALIACLGHVFPLAGLRQIGGLARSMMNAVQPAAETGST